MTREHGDGLTPGCRGWSRSLAANHQATDFLNVFARVGNLFDRHIEDPTGYLRPGLSAYAGLRLAN